MKLYSQDDFEQSKKCVRVGIVRMLLCAAPFFAAACAGFVLRIQWLCTAGLFFAGAVMILTYDTKIMPAVRYGAHLSEIHRGLSRKTAGALVRIGQDPVHDIGLNFYEVMLNIYEDMDEEGERRFLLDEKKQIPQQWLGKDVAVTHHGSYILEIHPQGEEA